MTVPVRIGLIGLLLAATVAFTQHQEPSSVRPFIALMHAGQVLPPHQPLAQEQSAFFLFDEASRELTFTLSGDPRMVFAIRGPAMPGETGPQVAAGPWSPGPITVGPLTGPQIKALGRGRLFIQLFQPSALPELQRATRGQLLPVAGVHYKAQP